MRHSAFALLLFACACAAPLPHETQPMAGLAQTVRIAARERQVVVEGDGVIKSVELAGAMATVRLTGGQTLTAAFDPATESFHVEVLEDGDSAVDVAIGRTTIHATRGDEFTARVLGAHLDITVRRGLVIVVGPDARRAELAQDGQLTVSGGGTGALLGPVGEAKRDRPPRGIPREPRRGPIMDRTDVAPAP